MPSLVAEKAGFFVLLRAFDRFASILDSRGIDLPEPVPLCLDQLWQCLAAGGPAPDIERLSVVLDAAIVDEQGASSQQILRNLYLYALADFLCFFAEGEPSLGAAELSIIDAYDYMAAMRFLNDTKAGGAVVLTEEDERQIKRDVAYGAEIVALHADRVFAGQIVQWQEVLQYRQAP